MHCLDYEIHGVVSWLPLEPAAVNAVTQRCGSQGRKIITCTFSLSLVSYVGERPWWPRQSPNIGRKKKAKG